MIEIRNVAKKFNDNIVIKRTSVKINDTDIWIVTGELGRSTLLRILAGVVKPDSGNIIIDDRPVYDNPDIKRKIFLVGEDPYYFFGSSIMQMREYYRSTYADFNLEVFDKLWAYVEKTGVTLKSKFRTLTVSQVRIIYFIFALSSGANYLLCDQTFDNKDDDSLDDIYADLTKFAVCNEKTLIITTDNCDKLSALLIKAGEDTDANKIHRLTLE